MMTSKKIQIKEKTMKIKLFNKNLYLNKTTVANLHAEEMAVLKGGCTTETIEYTCAGCTYYCNSFDQKTTANTCTM